MQIILPAQFHYHCLIFVSVLLIISVMLLSCSHPVSIDSTFLTSDDVHQHTLSDQSIALNASTPALKVKRGLVITDNNLAFEEKINLIREAKKTIDLAYYIFKDDFSSSALSKALINAANRGVQVRLLLDYSSAYNDLDLFSMLERYGNQGKGTLQVRFYNRPTVNIIKDAVYLTLGCSNISQGKTIQTCGAAKYKEIESRFASVSQSDQKALNYNSGGSGLFLSAFYANNIQLMALAIREGQGLDKSMFSNNATTGNGLDTENLTKLVSLGELYLKARHAKGFQSFVAKLKLKLAFTLFGGEISPYYDAFTAYFPIEREHPGHASLRDWSYVKDFYHQKLLLVDGMKIQLGGRNIEDVYHMHPNKLIEHYVFMDTDVLLELKAGKNSMDVVFERLWNFTQMVASISDVRLHAPNDFLMASNKTIEICEKLTGEEQQSVCEKEVFSKLHDLEPRIQLAYNTMQHNAAEYHHQYAVNPEPNSPQFSIDAGAKVYYVENLPFVKPGSQAFEQPLVRHYGAGNGKEGHSGKYIHNLWLAALRNTCKQATAEKPQEVIMHNAYVFFPSNLLYQLAEMVTGAKDCRHVTINILTNSIYTTDLGIENYAARYSMKAFYDYVLSHRNTQKGAKLFFYEYLPVTKPGDTPRSLHSKVMIFGSDIFIGSANADVRSYMMDANNGLYIRNAPNLLSKYRHWFHSIVGDPQLSKDKTQDFTSQTLQTMLAEDIPRLQSILLSNNEGLPDQQPLSTSIQSQVAKQLKAVLDSIYSLSLRSLGNGRDRYEVQDHFNQLFKLI